MNKREVVPHKLTKIAIVGFDPMLINMKTGTNIFMALLFAVHAILT